MTCTTLGRVSHQADQVIGPVIALPTKDPGRTSKFNPAWNHDSHLDDGTAADESELPRVYTINRPPAPGNLRQPLGHEPIGGNVCRIGSELAPITAPPALADRILLKLALCEGVVIRS